MAGRVAIVGGRHITPAVNVQVQSVATSLVAHGYTLVAGCATGADRAVVAAALTGSVPLTSLQVFAAFGPDGRGACGVSAVSDVQAFAAQGGAVTWWAGGGPSVPLRARLAARAAQVVSQASSGVVAFQPGKGSWRACRLAAGRGLRVVAFTNVYEALGMGEWVPCAVSGTWASARRWVPASLF